MKRKIVIKLIATTLAASVMASSFGGAVASELTRVYAQEVYFDLVETNYAFDPTSGWDTNGSKENVLNITTSEVPVVGTALVMDVLIPGDTVPDFSNIIKPVAILRTGSNWNWIQSNTIPELRAQDFDEEVIIDNQKYYKASVAIDFGETVGANDADGWNGNMKFEDAVTETVSAVTVQFAGYQCDYSGSIFIANARLEIPEVVEEEDIYVDSTVLPIASVVQLPEIASTVRLVDANASTNTKAVYAYLQAMGESENVIFGHQNDTWHKAGNGALSNSDTMDVVGSISGVVGIDALSLTGNEYSAARYNSELGKGKEKLTENAKGNVSAAAKLTNYNIEQGAIITLSAHMPNFSEVKENTDYDSTVDPTYAKYDFSGYTPNLIKNDVMNEIMPGGKYNEQYTAYLDMIADYASQVDGTILFRPFHENTGSWFWWGKAYCDSATYKNVYKYTVEYLRDTKDIHNLLYVYGPGSEASSIAEYEDRYPGDNYVDMVGFDMYHSAPTNDDKWISSFKAELNIVDEFAKSHNKLIAVTETGVANSADRGDNQTALHKVGNEQMDWYNTMLDAVAESSASYFLVWANFGKKDGFYTPYVESVNGDVLHGHEMLDNFISFYNDERSIFASDQKEALKEIAKYDIDAESTSAEVTGYIIAPVSGKRILGEVKLTASVSNEQKNDIKFVCKNQEKEVEVSAVNYNGSYEALLTNEALNSLGEGVGTIDLYAGNEKLDTVRAIFNIPEAKKDPYEIDGFETYFGEASLLQKEWATNKDSGCTIDISLSDEEGRHCEGDYSLKFSYNEKVGGWAGATIAKEVDWSGCNALSFWTIPDGKNQKVVIQITAGGKEYEAYLNNYDEYRDCTTPVYVTIPFDKFVDRDGDGPEGGLVELLSQINSFGLWVNQIGSEPVAGTIYYDKITAISTDITDVIITENSNLTDDDQQVETPDDEGQQVETPDDEGQQVETPGNEDTKPDKNNEIKKVVKTVAKAVEKIVKVVCNLLKKIFK